MEAGKLNQRITFQKITSSTTDAKGNTVDVWSDIGTVWGSIITTGGREFYAAQKVNAETTALFTIRYTKAVTSDMRIKYGTQIFEILPPINNVNGANIELQISAKEVI